MKHAPLLAAALLLTSSAFAQQAAPPGRGAQQPGAARGATQAKPPAPKKEVKNAKGETTDHIFGLALVAGAKGHLDEAIKLYSEVIQLEPDRQEAYANRAIVYYVDDQYQKALDDFNKAIGTDETELALIENRGLTYIRLNQMDKAVMDFDKVLWADSEGFQRGRGGARPLYARGLARVALGDIAGGYGDRKVALEKQPDIEKYFSERKFKLPAAAPNPLPPSTGQMAVRFQEAIEDGGKQPLLVQITVVDDRSKAQKTTCVPAPNLLAALQAENGIKADVAGLVEARKLALANKTREFHFSKQPALTALKIAFTQKDLDAALAQIKNDVDVPPYAGYLPGYRIGNAKEMALACGFVMNGKPVRMTANDKVVLP
jgi:tetratricopeptide (TPR) repeat protein